MTPDLAILDRPEEAFRPAGRRLPKLRSEEDYPVIETYKPRQSTLMDLALESVAAAGIASLTVAAGFVVARDTLLPIEKHAHYRFLSDLPTSSISTVAFVGRVMDEESHDELPAMPSWERLAETVGWIQEAAARINYLAAKVDGWKGEASVGASASARDDVFAFLDKLQVEAPTAAPMISLDEDGEFVLYWNTEGLLASVSIGGNKKFTFFGNRGSGDIIREDIDLTSPLPPEVVGVLSAHA